MDKGHLVSMWIVAADRDGIIPSCPSVLRKICQVDDPPDVKKFIDLGFLTDTEQLNDVKVASSWRQGDSPETETETDIEADKRPCAPNGARFDEWYAQYPKKKGKAAALKTWKRKKLDCIADTILADTMKRAQIEWTDDQFIPMASTYINQERWQDEDFKPRSNGKTRVEQSNEITHNAIMALGGYDDLPF